MRTRPYPKTHPLFFFILAIGSLISCKSAQNESVTPVIQAQEGSPVLAEPTSIPLIPTATLTMDSFSEELTPTAVTPLTETTIITAPTLINLDVPLITDNLPAYGWFSDDSQEVYFAYPEEGVVVSYDIATEQLDSTPLLQKTDDQIIEQIAADLPSNARVVDISPRYQNILYTIPIAEPLRLERGAFSVPLGYELWLYKETGSHRLGTVDECFVINMPLGASWSPTEIFATLNAFSATACAWENWLIDLEAFSVTPIDEAWEEGNSGFYVAAILPNKQLLLTALLKREPSAILDLPTRELTVFSNQGDEIVRYFDDTVFLDFLFWRSRDETEILFSPLNEIEWQLIDTAEGLIRAKFVSPNQKQVLLFSGSPDYYGLSENQETSGVWLLTLP